MNNKDIIKYKKTQVFENIDVLASASVYTDLNWLIESLVFF